ncbi:Unannotated [Lentimonas sp. CC4]|nr:Unannotated [Lentimonas sp. CC4]CAA6684367.1 Unannotated [Lentimonas sp. CC6]CAA7078113.1 Unannotated [Lentimonas sp. CC4]CAA7172071.1 Unannotated [Lentimonas sp. CC21]CAA7183127.1 Unannotated [Lentimonas sp. CC8]
MRAYNISSKRNLRGDSITIDVMESQGYKPGTVKCFMDGLLFAMLCEPRMRRPRLHAWIDLLALASAKQAKTREESLFRDDSTPQLDQYCF